MTRVPALLALLVAAGCRKADAVQLDAGPPVIRSSESSGVRVACTEGFCAEGTYFAANDDGITLRVDGTPGSTITIDGHETKLTRNGQEVSSPELFGRFADLRVPEDHLEVELNGAKSKLFGGDFLRKKIEAAKAGPVLFPGETTATPNRRKLVYVRSWVAFGGPTFIGQGRWRDIDFVAYVIAASTTEQCPKKSDGRYELLQSEVTLSDRRTGQVVDKTEIAGRGECSDAGGGLPAAANNAAAIEEWLKSKLVP